MSLGLSSRFRSDFCFGVLKERKEFSFDSGLGMGSVGVRKKAWVWLGLIAYSSVRVAAC